MSDFIKLNAYVSEDVHVRCMWKQEPSDYKCSDGKWVNVVDEKKIEPIWVNLSEIGTVKYGEVTAIDSSKVVVDRDKSLDIVIGARKEFGAHYLDPEKWSSSDLEHEVFHKVKCGIITLKHGTSRNLGLNGTEHHQLLFIDLKSLEKLDKALESISKFEESHVID